MLYLNIIIAFADILAKVFTEKEGYEITESNALRNIDGINSDSCLCGGDKPTTCCGDVFKDVCLDENCKVRNLCEGTERKRNSHCKEPCYDCKKSSCKYFITYNPDAEPGTGYDQSNIKYSFGASKKSKNCLEKKTNVSKCCPGSLGTYAEEYPCDENCVLCRKVCKKDEKGKYIPGEYKYLTDNSPHNWPCCKGTEEENISDPDCKSKNKGGRIPPCNPILLRQGKLCVPAENKQEQIEFHYGG